MNQIFLDLILRLFLLRKEKSERRRNLMFLFLNPELDQSPRELLLTKGLNPERNLSLHAQQKKRNWTGQIDRIDLIQIERDR